MISRTIVTFGELLLRLDTPTPKRFAQSDQFQVSFTGGEANVAVALAQWGQSSRIISSAPTHALGDACVNHFRRYGVETTGIVRQGDRLGILYVETGAAHRSPQVIYDRSESAFCHLTAEACDWDQLYAEADWLHVTGTAPAVSQTVRETLMTALSEAKQRGMRISLDCSYRSALWSVEEAADVLPQVLESCDVFFGSESDLEQFFGIQKTGSAGIDEFQAHYGLSHVVLSQRDTHADGSHTYSAQISDSTDTCKSREYRFQVVDRIGAGDALAAGVIRGLRQEDGLQQTIDFATAAAVLKHTIPGDFALVSVEEVEQFAKSGQAVRGWR